jgi:hypothetical protein
VAHQRQSLAEQLEPLAKRSRASISNVRKVSQVAVRIVGGADQKTSFGIARRNCLAWISKRAGQQLPKEAWNGESFTLDEVGAQRTAAVALSRPVAWAARLDDADKAVPQRYWTTEIAAAYGNQSAVLFGCRLQCSSLGEDQPFVRSIPGIVQQLVTDLTCMVDGRRLSLEPWIVSTESDVEDLVAFLTYKNRIRDVLVFALPEGSEDPEQTIVPTEPITRRTLGAAHIVILTGPASYALSDRVGKEFSVFMQAVRTYRPGLNADTGQPFDHPLSLPYRIANWPDGGPQAFVDFLIDRTLHSTVTGRNLENELPSFQEFSRTAIEISRSEAKAAKASETELLELAEIEIKQLQSQTDETKETFGALLAQADSEIAQLKASLSQAQEDSKNQRWRIAHLETAIAQKKGASLEAIQIPSDFSDLEEWSRQYLSGSVAIHNRAIRAAKKSAFEDVKFAYSVLLLLRDHYVPMRREGGLDKKEAYENELAAMGLDESPTFAGARAGEEGDAYFVEFGGRKRELDRHIKGSNSRDERFGFRLYFFWDDETDQVIVGWFPSHLPTRAT